MTTKSTHKLNPQQDANSLEGHLLLAMPDMPDNRFANAVVYICAHSAEGAMGLVINNRAPDVQFSDLAEKLQFETADPSDGQSLYQDVDVLIGGPVEQRRGFVLHTPDYTLDDSTLTISNEFCLTATLDIVCSIAVGEGPSNALLALGYAGWGPGQLEGEIRENGWLHCPATTELVFGTRLTKRYTMALASMGINEAHLSMGGGTA